ARVQGDPHGRPDGQRACHRAQPRGRPRGRRTQPAAREGRRARPERRPGHGPVRGQEAAEEGGLIMPKVDLLDRAGTKVGDRDLPDELFDATINVPLMHQIVIAGLASLRAGTHSTKTRAEVRGGGRKPCRQKGTGRARQASTRAPHWAGGGLAHGPKPRNYDQRTPKKMKAAALRSALTDSLRSDKIAVIDGFEFEEPRTKDAVQLIMDLELTGKILVVLDQPTEVVEKSFNNLPYVKVSYARSLNVYELL